VFAVVHVLPPSKLCWVGTKEAGGKLLVRMVSAQSEANNLVLDQRKVDEKSSESKTIPRPL